jgi:putative ABC transport system permease protein
VLKVAEQVALDLGYALRRMRRRPALSVAIVLTIGLGLGAAAAVFTTFRAALIDPQPFASSERLAHLWETRAGADERNATSYPTLLEWRSRVSTFAGLEGYNAENMVVGLGTEARMLRGAQVTTGFLRLLGVRVESGRDFLPDEDGSSGERVAIVSERFARSLGSEAALDHAIKINGTARVIVGVMPSEFHFALLQDADIFVPLTADPAARANRGRQWISVIGRLRDGAALSAASGQLAAVTSELSHEYPDVLAGRSATAVPLRDALLGSAKPILISLLVAVLLLLATMAANLALLMLARYVERTPELAMRSALGASRGRIVRQLLVESVVLSLVGSGLAIGIGDFATRSLIRAIPERVMIDLPYLANTALDARMVAIIVAIAILLSIVFGLGPALLVTKRADSAGDVRSTAGRSDRRLRKSLVVSQMALTVVLLVASGLLVVSFERLVGRDVGFVDPTTLMTARVSLSGERYQAPIAQQQFYETLIARTAALPGVRSAGVISQVPGAGRGVTTFDVVDQPRPLSQQPQTALRIIGGDYFGALGVPLLAGRTFQARDRMDAPPAAVVSARFAKLLGDPRTALGRRVRLALSGNIEYEIVGVIGDVQVADLDADSPPVIYVSHAQRAENRMSLVLRTRGAVDPIANEVRGIVKDMDADIPVYSVSTLHQQLSESRAVFSRRFPMILCSVFAAAALALALIALYAMSTHEMLTRHREFGIRLALGGPPSVVRQMILKDGLMMAVVGIGIGELLAMSISRVLSSVLFGITATDWRVYGAVAAGVLASAVFVTIRPAMRAGSVNPSIVMRGE